MIVKAFDKDKGKELEEMIKNFFKVWRAGLRGDHIRNLANDIRNFIINATEEIDVQYIKKDQEGGNSKNWEKIFRIFFNAEFNLQVQPFNKIS